ncbi:portal protein [Clostridia bacterium]|nr:portal protein [Clostridia bacterium]
MIAFDFAVSVNEIIVQGAKNRLTDVEFIENEIQRFLNSKRRRDMINGERYFKGEHDILHRKRTMIGENGKLENVENVPNNRVVDNQYKKMVNQKVNYLLGQPVTIQSDNTQYAETIKQFLNKRFLRLIKNVGRDSLNCGVGWLFLHYDEQGEFQFKRFKPYEIIAGWKDDEHTSLEYAIRLYEIISYEGKNEKTVQKVEVYDEKGIHRFILDGSRLIPDFDPYNDIKTHEPYFTVIQGEDELDFNWSRIPLIPFKYNTEEIPLIRNVKPLQDGLNLILSNFENNMEEDARNTILVLVNYDGENLAEFRKNLSTYGAVKLKTVDGAAGDLRTLQVEVNAANYQAIIEIFKKAIIENAMGYDAKDDRLGGNANQLNIMSMYSDIDLDANEMETEYQASFEELIRFINLHLANTGQGDFDGVEVEVIFNRDMLISESEIITNIQNSVGILSEETLIAQHPWVDDPLKELERVKEEKAEAVAEAQKQFGDAAFNPAVGGKETVVTEEYQSTKE